MLLPCCVASIQDETIRHLKGFVTVILEVVKHGL